MGSHVRKSSLSSSKGFSLIELLLVLGVVAILLVAAFVVYPRVRQSQQINQEVSNLSTLQAGIRAAFAPTGGVYTALDTMQSTKGRQFVNQSRIAPSSMNGGDVNSTELKNSWGGDVIIHATISPYAGNAAGRMFAIRYNNVPAEACVDFVSRSVAKFDAMWVNGSSGTSYLTPENFSVSQAVARCNVASPAEVVFMSN